MHRVSFFSLPFPHFRYINEPNNTITVDKLRKQQETYRLYITKTSNLVLSSTFFGHLMQTANRAVAFFANCNWKKIAPKLVHVVLTS